MYICSGLNTVYTIWLKLLLKSVFMNVIFSFFIYNWSIQRLHFLMFMFTFLKFYSPSLLCHNAILVLNNFNSCYLPFYNLQFKDRFRKFLLSTITCLIIIIPNFPLHWSPLVFLFYSIFLFNTLQYGYPNFFITYIKSLLLLVKFFIWPKER